MAGVGLVTAHRDGLSWWTRDDLLEAPVKQVWQWDPDDVGRWLSIIDGMEDEWIMMFKEHHVTGVRLMRMSPQQIANIGVDSGGMATKLVDEIMRVRKHGVSKHVHRYVVDDDEQAENICWGVIEAVRALVIAVFEGLFSVIYEPAKGVRQEGSEGFFEGIGAAFEKLFYGPLLGACEAIRQISDGIKNTPVWLFDTEDEMEEELLRKIKSERLRLAHKIRRGKKEVKIHTLEMENPLNIFWGIFFGVKRFGLSMFMAFYLIATEPCKKANSPELDDDDNPIMVPVLDDEGKPVMDEETGQPAMEEETRGAAGFAAGVGKGLCAMICRPISAVMDLVERPLEGLINTPNAMFDACMRKDPLLEESKIGSDMWWERQAGGGAAAFDVVSGIAKKGRQAERDNPNMRTGALAANTVAGLNQAIAEQQEMGTQGQANIPLHMREQLAAATAQASGAQSDQFGAHVTGRGVGPQQGVAIDAPLYGIKSQEAAPPEDLVALKAEREAKEAGLSAGDAQQQMMAKMQAEQDAAAAAQIGQANTQLQMQQMMTDPAQMQQMMAMMQAMQAQQAGAADGGTTHANPLAEGADTPASDGGGADMV